ncbi:hypothetical protein PsorP6_012384 [Peronosclerospora sorghi]|uniref:Uncharacterized protein n=1 Tax=Peronosclerospora sorghi TaxID=230839 RepID=A0ACC0WI22_9STRA|nr:hypothetical protein PsorP6_012384 [Peronosclerospora sorghi]
MLLDWGDDELQVALTMCKFFLLGTNVFLFLTAALVFLTSSSTLEPTSQTQLKRALIVTAHPDDESMFFLPLVHSLQQESSTTKWQIHLLCLSRGNFDGLGSIRENELKSCTMYIGLSTRHVQVLEDPKLQDGMKNEWDTAHIGAIVSRYIERNEIDAVFTFDDFGVSGHPNHISTHFGVKQAIREQQEKCSAAGRNQHAEKETKVVGGWALESTSILRKYTGILDTALSFWLSRRKGEESNERQFVFVCRPLWNYRVMAIHQSQFVWYRRLFVIFSRYTFINTFHPLLSVGSTNVTADYKKAL